MEDAEKFFATYCDFVTKVTSGPSLKIDDLKASLDEIQKNSNIDVPRLLTCLLYTSPSPRDATLSRMPSSA